MKLTQELGRRRVAAFIKKDLTTNFAEQTGGKEPAVTISNDLHTSDGITDDTILAVASWRRGFKAELTTLELKKLVARNMGVPTENVSPSFETYIANNRCRTEIHIFSGFSVTLNPKPTGSDGPQLL